MKPISSAFRFVHSARGPAGNPGRDTAAFKLPACVGEEWVPHGCWDPRPAARSSEAKNRGTSPTCSESCGPHAQGAGRHPIPTWARLAPPRAAHRQPHAPPLRDAPRTRGNERRHAPVPALRRVCGRSRPSGGRFQLAPGFLAMTAGLAGHKPLCGTVRAIGDVRNSLERCVSCCVTPCRTKPRQRRDRTPAHMDTLSYYLI